MRTLIFGGTFDPVHCAHLILAEQAAEQMEAGLVLFIPTYRPPHKGKAVASGEDRLEMVRLAIADNARFAVSDLEIRRQGPSYTIDTLRCIQDQGMISLDEAFLLIGGDSLSEFDTWKDWRDILSLCRLLVAPRPGISRQGPPEAVSKAETLHELPRLEISSSNIRERLRKGLSIRYLVPEKVAAYIGDKHLYQKGRLSERD